MRNVGETEIQATGEQKKEEVESEHSDWVNECVEEKIN